MSARSRWATFVVSAVAHAIAVGVVFHAGKRPAYDETIIFVSAKRGAAGAGKPRSTATQARGEVASAPAALAPPGPASALAPPAQLGTPASTSEALAAGSAARGVAAPSAAEQGDAPVDGRSIGLDVVYPRLSRELGEEGRVIIAKGVVEKSSGYPRLDEASLASVKNATEAQKMMINGRRLVFNFQLRK